LRAGSATLRGMGDIGPMEIVLLLLVGSGERDE
jgi:hypothetical protein